MSWPTRSRRSRVVRKQSAAERAVVAHGRQWCKPAPSCDARRAHMPVSRPCDPPSRCVETTRRPADDHRPSSRPASAASQHPRVAHCACPVSRGSVRALPAAASAARRSLPPKLDPATPMRAARGPAHRHARNDPCVLGRAGVVLGGIHRVAGLLVVLCGHAEKVVGARAREAREPARHLAVQLAPRTLEHGVVGDLVQDLVPEGVFAQTLERCPRRAARRVRVCTSAGSAARARRAPPAAWSQNTGPITLASCSACLSGAGRPSSRACSTPVSVGGTCVASSLSRCRRPRRRPISMAPWSISIFTSSSM